MNTSKIVLFKKVDKYKLILHLITKYMNEKLEELDSNIAFEEQRTLDEAVWTKEYHSGYVVGLKQARDILNDK